jgi:hypothetical protein
VGTVPRRRFRRLANVADGSFSTDPTSLACRSMSASLIGRSGSSTFRLSTTAASMSLAGSRFSSDSAPRPVHNGVRRRGGTIFAAALPSACVPN